MAIKKSAEVLRFKDGFKDHPEREREDLKGRGEFNPEPPEYLEPEYHHAWHWIVARLPAFAFASGEEASVAHLVRLHQRLIDADKKDDLETTIRLTAPYWKALTDMGMTLSGRAKFGSAKGKEEKNRYGRLKKDD